MSAAGGIAAHITGIRIPHKKHHELICRTNNQRLTVLPKLEP
jgi:hypothetical protein